MMTYKQIKLGNELYIVEDNPIPARLAWLEPDYIHNPIKWDRDENNHYKAWKYFETNKKRFLWLGEEFEGVKTEDEIEVVWQYLSNFDCWEDCGKTLYTLQGVKDRGHKTRLIARLKPIEQKQEQKQLISEIMQADEKDGLYNQESNILPQISDKFITEQQQPVQQEAPVEAKELIEGLDRLMTGYMNLVDYNIIPDRHCANANELADLAYHLKTRLTALQSPPTLLKDLSQIEDEEKIEIAEILGRKLTETNRDSLIALAELTIVGTVSASLFKMAKVARYLEKKGYRLNTINQL